MCKETAMAQALLDVDDVARKRGDKFGPCDSIDNSGNPYPSAGLVYLLKYAREQLNLEPERKGRKIKDRWLTSKQWE